MKFEQNNVIKNSKSKNRYQRCLWYELKLDKKNDVPDLLKNTFSFIRSLRVIYLRLQKRLKFWSADMWILSFWREES